MAVKGKTKEQKADFVKELYVGLTSVKVAAINPTRAQLNTMLGKDEDGKEEKEEFKYLDTDKDGKTRLRLAFWLHDEENDKYFVQSITLTDEDRKSKDGKKVQIINSTTGTSWVPLREGKNGELTDEADSKLIQDWFLQFTNKEKEVIGEKKWRIAKRGEEELGILLRAWISMDWYDPETEVMLDMKKLFQENLKELREMVGSDEYAKPFVILTGVKTSEEDSTKKYQQVFNKAYLPSSMMKYVKAGNKFPTDYTRNAWKKFTDEAKDQYGFTCFHKLVPLTKYVESEDPVSGNSGKPKVQEPANNEY
jgi:hypothetical protein